MTMTMYTPVVLNLLTALGLGVMIGIERQWRQRAAGLRTNALVSLGSAAFVALATLVEGENSPTRIAAQVASGIGFLGAGVIIHEGTGVRGLNTAATLWGAASVGVLAGSGYLGAATITAVLVLISNILLRPIASRIDQLSEGANELERVYRLRFSCHQEREQHLRALMIQLLSDTPLILRGLHSEHSEGGARARVEATLIANTPAHGILEELVARLSLEPGVFAVSWEAELGHE